MTQRPFSEHAWQTIAAVRSGIEDLPFVRDLAGGTLDRAKFDYYMTQDALYLAEYARALAACAAQSTTGEDLVFWAESARDCIVVERALHDSHVGDVSDREASPTCVAYTGHLHSLVSAGCYPALAAGVLPCFWIYEDVGRALVASAGDLSVHPYGDWIATYVDESFAQATRTAIGTVDRLAAGSSAEVRQRMLTAFERAARFEYLFWDAAERLESWPIR